jgi:hypothetical protein
VLVSITCVSENGICVGEYDHVLVSIAYILVSITCVGESGICYGEYNMC